MIEWRKSRTSKKSSKRKKFKAVKTIKKQSFIHFLKDTVSCSVQYWKNKNDAKQSRCEGEGVLVYQDGINVREDRAVVDLEPLKVPFARKLRLTLTIGKRCGFSRIVQCSVSLRPSTAYHHLTFCIRKILSPEH